MRYFITIIFLFTFFTVDAQNFHPFKESWHFDAGYGTSLFLGDIAPVPKFTFKRNSDDYVLAYNFRFGKRLNKYLIIDVEMIRSNLRGSKEFDAAGTPMNLAFKGNLWGVTINAQLDLFKLLHLNTTVPISIYCRVGGGPIFYRSIKTHLESGQYWYSMGYTNDGSTKSRRIQTSVIPYGFGIYYEFSDNLCAELESGLYNATTDLLDAHHGLTSKSNDKFAVTTINMRYTFDWNNWQAPSFNYYR